jgi:DNA-nicking Smr family endonuclease
LKQILVINTSIDLHGIRHKEALEKVETELLILQEQGSFSLTIITGNSSILQERILKKLKEQNTLTYYIPSWNLGQIIVDYIEL